MTHDFIDLPSQRHASPGVQPVVAAVESTRFLREQLDCLPTATVADREVLQHEVAMLQHWLRAARTESGEYHAVIDGVADFADQAAMLLASTDVPEVPAPR